MRLSQYLFAAKLRSDGSQAAAADQQKQDAANRYLFGSRIHVRACCGVNFMAEAKPPGIQWFDAMRIHFDGNRPFKQHHRKN